MATIGERLIERLGGVTNHTVNEIRGRHDKEILRMARTSARQVEAVTRKFEAQLEQATTRAYEAGFYDGAEDEPASGDIAMYGYRPVGGAQRDNKNRNEALKSLWHIWNSSDTATWLLETRRDHIIGHNALPTSDDEDLQETLRSFWKNNKMTERMGEFVVQLMFFGEQCYTVFIRESDGAVSLGYIDPANIEDVVHNPDNALEPCMVVVDMGNAVKRVYRIVRPDAMVKVDGKEMPAKYEGKLTTHKQSPLADWERETLEKLGKNSYDGDCLFKKIGAFSNQTRGVPLLQRTADWLDQLDEVLFSLGEREQEAGFFSWDVAIENADDGKIRERQKELQNNPPRRGSVRVHGAGEEWDLKVPDIKQAGSIATFRAMLGYILGGRGFPVHWYGFGDDANRATSESQSTPTLKRLEYDQAIIKNMFMDMLTLVCDQACIANPELKDFENAGIDLPLPEISKKGLLTIVESLPTLATSLMTATDAGWMSDEKAGEVWAKILSEVGVTVDAVEDAGTSDLVDKANEYVREYYEAVR